MKAELIVNRILLTDALNSAARCLEKRNTIPILATFRLTSDVTTLTITATDLDQAVRIELPATGKAGNEFDVCVDGKMLVGLVSRLSGEDVGLSVDSKHLFIARDSGDIKLLYISSDNYPKVQFGKEYLATFEINELSEVCKSVLLGTVEDRVARNSFHNVAELSVERDLVEGKFRCLSSDGYRMAIVNGLCYTDEADPFKLQVPVSAIRTLLAGLKGAKGQVRIGQGENHIFVAVGEARDFSFRKVIVTFPNIEYYLKSLNFDKRVVVEAEQLRDSLELVGQMVNPRSRSVKIALDGDLTLSAQSTEVGEVKDSIDAEIDFEGFEVGFNIDYILPLMRQMSGEIDLIFAKDERKTPTAYPLRVTKFANNVTSSFDVQSLNAN